MLKKTFQSADELYADLAAAVPQLSVESYLSNRSNILLIDCRELEEMEQGFIPGALKIPKGQLELQIESSVPNRNQKILFYCASGRRSLFCAAVASAIGYTNSASLAGGIKSWKDGGHPITEPAGTGRSSNARYEAQMKLPEFSNQGQDKLALGKVLIVGAGGLGSPTALYLAAAGIGEIVLIDDDRVDESNLQRQILHGMDRIGSLKVESARISLRALNPNTRVRGVAARLSIENVDELVAAVDIVIDGSDNFQTKFLLNDASVKHGKILIQASVFQFGGQIGVFNFKNGPCFRCLFPNPPAPDVSPNCADGGVIGAVPGVLGAMAAMEAIKLITGIGDPISSRLLRYDGALGTVDELRFRKRPDCSVCSEDSSAVEYQSHAEFQQTCGS